ncbi:MAG: hypothetical protein SFX18_11015 [Pirellulales bacterium]|nr:hypothetical protein [Pirellulales bacterium]
MKDPAQNADHLREQMRLVRQDLGSHSRTTSQEIQQLQREVKQALDWREYIRHSPWIWGGVALAIGYWLIPAKSAVKSERDLLQRLARKLEQMESSSRHPAKSSLWQSLMSRAMELAAQYGTGILMRQGMDFANKHFSQRGDEKSEQPSRPAVQDNHASEPFVRKHHA